MSSPSEPTYISLPEREFGPITLAVHQAGSGIPVVFAHGFPELAFSWRSQLSALGANGMHAIAPDQRGYGGSSAPEAIEAYDLKQLCGDLNDLCDALDVERAIFVGHDWGGGVTWAMPHFFPERVLGLVGVCTPYMAFPTTDLLRMAFQVEREEDHYMLWVQTPGVAEAVLDPQVELLFDRLMRSGVQPSADTFGDAAPTAMNPFRDLPSLPVRGAALGTAAERANYIETFEQTGFRGGLNWYRNMDRNAAEYPGIGIGDPGVPSLMVCAEWDPVLPPSLAANMPNVIADLEMHTVEECGHWLPQERPEELNQILIDWIQRRFMP